MSDTTYRISSAQEYGYKRGYFYEYKEEWLAFATAASDTTGSMIVVVKHSKDKYEVAQPDEVIAVFCKGQRIWPLDFYHGGMPNG